eukprot:g8499.t2
MATVSDLTSHFQVEPALWAAFVHEVGSLGEDIRLVAALPGKLVAAALGQASFPGDRPLTTIQAARVGLVSITHKLPGYRAVWRRILSPPPPPPPPPPGPEDRPEESHPKGKGKGKAKGKRQRKGKEKD